FGRGQDAVEFVECGRHRLVECDGGNRRRVFATSLARRECDRSGRELAVEDRTRSDFIPVVIFGFNPEDWYRRDLEVARDLVGELSGRERFEEGVERPAEEASLLACHDGHCTWIGKLPRGAQRPFGCSTAALLRREDVGDLLACTRAGGLNARNSVRPRCV